VWRVDPDEWLASSEPLRIALELDGEIPGSIGKPGLVGFHEDTTPIPEDGRANDPGEGGPTPVRADDEFGQTVAVEIAQ
jgi:hypothetical protein